LGSLHTGFARSDHDWAHKRETQKLIHEAIEFHLEGLREDDLPIPEPSASAEVVSVS
jgi:hypothetical protein